MAKVKKTPYYSYSIKGLPKGCKLCVKGRKTVLFATGLCSLNCFFCPISDQKKNKDVIYYNEWPSRDIKNLYKEINLCQSKGVGITGGDPLMKLNRTCSYIRKLKKRYGKSFHIHLYTPLNLVNNTVLNRLYRAGLDEIRFHLDLYNDKLWERVKLASKFKWDVGVEIPVIPKLKAYYGLIDYIHDKVDFLNLNELEMSDTNASKVIEKGYRTKGKFSYAIRGSGELAKKLLKYTAKKGYNLKVHYCTAKLKDKIQLSSRIRLRAKKAAMPYDIVDEEGMLIRGAIFGKSPAKVRNFMVLNGVSEKYIAIDQKRKRLFVHASILEDIKEDLRAKFGKKIKMMVVKEYPTYDCFCVESFEM